MHVFYIELRDLESNYLHLILVGFKISYKLLLKQVAITTGCRVFLGNNHGKYLHHFIIDYEQQVGLKVNK